MPYVNVPNDLSKIKTKIAFNLTKRQLICFGAGAVSYTHLDVYKRQVPGRAVGRIGQEHIHAMLWQRAQALDPVHEMQRIQLWDILSQGHIHPSFNVR